MYQDLVVVMVSALVTVLLQNIQSHEIVLLWFYYGSLSLFYGSVINVWVISVYQIIQVVAECLYRIAGSLVIQVLIRMLSVSVRLLSILFRLSSLHMFPGSDSCYAGSEICAT
jgi:hypothetical protein